MHFFHNAFHGPAPIFATICTLVALVILLRLVR